MTNLFVSKRDGVVTAPDGTKHRVFRGKTLAEAGHPIVEAYPGDWHPMEVHLSAPGGTHAEQLQGGNDLDELRNELAEVEELAERRGAELQRLAEILAARGYVPTEDEAAVQGWVVDLAVRALDADATPAVRPPRAPRGKRATDE